MCFYRRRAVAGAHLTEIRPLCYPASMKTWLPILVLVAAVLAAGFLRERWRMAAIEKWARGRGLIRTAGFTPGARPPVAALVARIHPQGARIWGVVLEGEDLFIGEHESSKLGRKTGVWYTLVAWPVCDAAGPIVFRRASPDGPLEASPARDAWLTDDRRRRIEAWPHGGELVIDAGYAGWRFEGLLSGSRLDALTAQIAEARRLLE